MDLDRIAEAALALVDEGGLEALSMRKLGARLGVEAMTLYHYVKRKDDLLDLLVERAVLSAAEGPEAEGDGEGDIDWRRRLTGYARRLRAALLAHPSLLPLVMSRPVRSPAAMAQFVADLQALVQAGFDFADAYSALNGLALMVLGLATGEVNPPLTEAPPPDQAQADAAFRAMLAPLIGGEAAFAQRHERIFEFTLGAFIAGLAIRLKSETPTG